MGIGCENYVSQASHALPLGGIDLDLIGIGMRILWNNKKKKNPWDISCRLILLCFKIQVGIDPITSLVVQLLTRPSYVSIRPHDRGFGYLPFSGHGFLRFWLWV